MKNASLGTLLVAICLAFHMLAVEAATSNPYSPAYDHPYRAGVIPIYETWLKMQAWQSEQNSATPSNILSFHGGDADGIGVTSGKPKVYLVVYGSQWGTQGTDGNGDSTFSNDPVGAVPYLQEMIKGLGTGGELWSGTVTQYCDGPLVATGATSCPPGAAHVGYPTGDAFAGIWYDNSAPAPQQATPLELGQEASNAAQHFGNVTAASNRYTQYVILSPTGTYPDGFNTPSGRFCAWHNATGNVGGPVTFGNIAFTNLPYVFDMGHGACFTNAVNGDTPQGNLDGFSIVEGHEYAETQTDQTSFGWGNSRTGEENADECAFGAHENVILGGKPFAMQGLWSNDTDQCEIAHPIGQGVTPGAGSVATTAVTKGTSNIPVTMNFPLYRSGDTSFVAALSYHTAPGSAADGFDYFSTAGTLNLAAGAATASVPVTLGSYTFPGPSRTFSLVVDSAVGIGHAPAFLPQQTLSAGFSPFDVAVGDINLDGKPDIVTVNRYDNTFSVLVNTTPPGASTATYAAQQVFPTGAGPTSAVIADINGDGWPDIVIANFDGGTVQVKLNMTAPGQGTSVAFSAGISPAVGAGPAFVTAADINGDGKSDLIVTNSNGASISVLLNTTSTNAAVPSFAAQQTFATGNSPFGVTAADLDGDGRVDVVVANFTDNSLSAFRNTTIPGASTATFAVAQSLSVGSGPATLRITDINGDGRLDILAANAADGTFSALLNTGSFTFAGPQTGYVTPSLDVIVADVNGDGKPDLVVPSLTADGDVTEIYALINTTVRGSSIVSYQMAGSFPTGSNPGTAALADVNGDGKLDLIVCNYGAFDVANSKFTGNTLSVLLNVTPLMTTASPGSPEPISTGASSTSHPSAVAAGDLNGDGKPDLAVATNTDGTVSVLFNYTAPGAVFPAFPAHYSFSTGAAPASVAIADLNGDGVPDLIVANKDSDNVSVLRNITASGGPASFAAQQTFSTGTGTGPIGVTTADINQDGKIDLLVANQATATVSVLTNNTAPGATVFAFSTQTFGAFLYGTPVVADIDRDGRPDIIAASPYVANYVEVLRNTTTPGAATPSFAALQLFTTGAGPDAVAVADVNGDGLQDILVANVTDGTVSALINTTAAGAASATFSAQVAFPAGGQPTRLLAHDVNGDGRPDLLIVNASPNGPSLLINTTPTGAAVPSFTTQQFNAGYEPVDMAVADFNGDGQPDIAIPNYVSDGLNSTVSILLNRRYQVQVFGSPALGTIVHDYIFAAQFEP